MNKVEERKSSSHHSNRPRRGTERKKETEKKITQRIENKTEPLVQNGFQKTIS